MGRVKRGYVARGECRDRRSCYLMGCDSDGCLTAHSRWVKQNRKRRLDNRTLNHGTRSAYDAGCRCRRCESRRSLAYRDETAPHLKPYGERRLYGVPAPWKEAA